MNKYQILRAGIVLCLLAALVFIFYIAVRSRNADALVVKFFDIGQGDAMYIKSPSGRELLIDGSADKQILEKLGRTMNLFDRHIDVVVATHPDKDHIGGLPAVLTKYTVGLLLEPGTTADNGVYDELLVVAKNKSVKIVQAYAGQSIDLGGDAIATVLYPNRSVLGMETNESSIVILLTYGSQSFLFTGDAPLSTEYSILNKLPELSVLKAGHHGSQTSTSFELLEKTTPEYTVLSVGANNSYGHPHRNVVARLQEFRSQILRTDQKGDITFITDGDSIQMKTQK
jgi:competence protein ComEC